jgi:two-component system CitB family sensor kinase
MKMHLLLKAGSHIHKLKLNTRLILALCFMSALQAALIGGFAWYNLSRSLDGEIGQRALNAARTVAAIPTVIDGIEQQDLSALKTIAEHLTDVNNTLFIVIGDKAAIRLAHPNPAKLGKSMADDEGDQGSEVLIKGLAYVNKAEGSLGPSMRARAPVYDASGEKIIGVVSVGFSLAQVEDIIARYNVWLLAILLLALFGSVSFAIIIATRLKREIFGLEPEQIARLFEEREATLQSVREGIIAINREGQITTFNRTAIETLGLTSHSTLLGKSIADVLPESNLTDVLSEGKPQFDQEVWLNDRQMIVNRVPVKKGDVIVGAVSSFRARDELDLVSQKLTRIEQYADSLRSQAHEYSNKLHTISGLIQLDAKEEALQLIGSETHDHQQLIQFLLSDIPNPVIAGCLLGKYNRAKEMGLALVIDPESHVADLPNTLTLDQLVSLLGNLIDNALEATWKTKGSGGEVLLSMTDIGNDLIIEVQDQGPGIPKAERERIFEKGVSTKTGTDHGLGLHLIRKILSHCSGSIEIEPTDSQGTRIICYLPKRRATS